MSKIIFEVEMSGDWDPDDLLCKPDEVTANGNYVFRLNIHHQPNLIEASAELMAAAIVQRDGLSGYREHVSCTS